MINSSYFNAASILLVLPFILAFVLYLFAVKVSRNNNRNWPLHRTIVWISGILSAVSAVFGPIAQKAHMDFTFHMIGHLLLGMLAPLLLALAKPVTLALRTLSVTNARKLSRILRSRPVRFLSNPIIAAILNIGGLWALYATDLFLIMHESLLAYLIIHIHVFLAGYLFTISLIYLEAVPHRHSFVFRASVFVCALAGHGILSKYIYANPPENISIEEAKSGGKVMYYGGDLIDLVIIFILCLHWYQATNPRRKGHA
ncbi:cytochrome c oxidase assembly protein [Virgibacillus flavescens]|uniref:cytochrome c oxidase assembly protein n=1 Tax=Virgibacillus flavescens TaxID=1611422 RepID=UPI003D354885